MDRLIPCEPIRFQRSCIFQTMARSPDPKSAKIYPTARAWAGQQLQVEMREVEGVELYWTWIGKIVAVVC